MDDEEKVTDGSDDDTSTDRTSPQLSRGLRTRSRRMTLQRRHGEMVRATMRVKKVVIAKVMKTTFEKIHMVETVMNQLLLPLV